MNNSSFQWMQPDALPAAITVDAHRRIYLSTEARKLLDVKYPYRLAVGFDRANQRIIVAKPEIVRVPDVKPFVFDKRNYAHAKRFVRDLGFTDAELPLRFEYAGKDYADYPEGAFCFGRVDFDAPDSAMVKD